jgi:futalosine hydrolase
MRILVVAATELEIPRLGSGAYGTHHVDVTITGVGMVATAARVARALALTRYDAAFAFGVCGSFDRALTPGDVVHVISDGIPELGVEDGDRFVSLEELGLVTSTVIENTAPLSSPALDALPRVRSITVNTAHGHEDTIAAIVRRANPQVESMEGAAFACACALSQVPYAQVRAVSNIVERRNRAAWRMDLAVQRLNDVARTILGEL